MKEDKGKLSLTIIIILIFIAIVILTIFLMQKVTDFTTSKKTETVVSKGVNDRVWNL